MPPLTQLSLLLGAYGIHVGFLSEVRLRLPLFPEAVYLENILGSIAVASAAVFAARRLHTSSSEDDGGGGSGSSSTATWRPPWGEIRTPRAKLLQTAGTLLTAYLVSGYLYTDLLELLLNGVAALGVPLGPGRHRAAQVLLSHLAWVAIALRVLRVRLGPFLPPPFGKGRWIAVSWRSHWLGWALGGYFASLLSYNVVEAANVRLLPPPPDAAAAAAAAEESVVARLINPEGGDLVALCLGCLAPCVSAPLFEEVLYRGFLLPALCRFVPLRLALPAHALLFGLHHRSVPALLPLSALGLLWGGLYVASGNLLVPVLVHALWNSRIFLAALRDLL